MTKNAIRALFLLGVDRYNVHGNKAFSMPHPEGHRSGHIYRAGAQTAKYGRCYDRELSVIIRKAYV